MILYGCDWRHLYSSTPKLPRYIEYIVASQRNNYSSLQKFLNIAHNVWNGNRLFRMFLCMYTWLHLIITFGVWKGVGGCLLIAYTTSTTLHSMQKNTTSVRIYGLQNFSIALDFFPWTKDAFEHLILMLI